MGLVEIVSSENKFTAFLLLVGAQTATRRNKLVWIVPILALYNNVNMMFL